VRHGRDAGRRSGAGRCAIGHDVNGHEAASLKEQLAHIHFPDHHAEEDLPEGFEPDETFRDAIWKADNVELTTVGIDVGSSTSHLMFSRIHLQRLVQRLSSRFVVVRREVLWRSPIWLTPYRADNRIDADRLGEHFEQAYRQAGLTQKDVDSGAVILTGEALKRSNARAIADLFAEHAGKFVCASAGHNLEAIMAAHGSGAVALSRNGQVVLNIDVGGGTSKLALVRDGEVLDSAAMEVGGRLIATDGEGRVVRIESGARRVAEHLGIPLTLGEKLPANARAGLAQSLADVLVAFARREPLSPLGEALVLTEPLHAELPSPTAVTFSGGVAEFLYERETRDYGDLARDLAAELRQRIESGHLGAPMVEPSERIRATVIGASQFSVQLSGNTIAISDPNVLPFHNLPVLFPRLPSNGSVSSAEVTGAIRASLSRFDMREGEAPIALAFAWDGDPYYAALRALADGIAAALPSSIQHGLPLVLAFDRDVGKLVGDILKLELAVPNAIISIDGMELREFDFIDIGEVIQPTNVVPVVIKSLLFPEVTARLKGEVLDMSGE
jgi:ethanolamine utilization protein EutA